MGDFTTFLDGRVRLFAGDCRDGVAALADNSIDAVITDPPYALESIRKRFGGPNAAKAQHGRDGAFARASAGFMGQKWDTGEVAFDPAFWADVLRVLKPGGHVLAFSGTRTYHRLATAIEDAGFEIRDMTAWLYGTGFPKNHDVAKGIDKKLGAARNVVGRETITNDMRGGATLNVAKDGKRESFERDITEAGSPEAAKWEGWGTALKPAMEPMCLARKPLDGTVAETVLKWGTGGLNIGACRVDAPEGAVVKITHSETGSVRGYGGGIKGGIRSAPQTAGRYPANVLHDGSAEVIGAFPDAPGQQRAVGPEHGAKASVYCYGDFGPRDHFEPRGDAGSAARFFYSAKADGDDRVGSKHPTVKPVDLMRYFVRLVTPPGGLVLDPFAGTGTTGAAAFYEGFSAILCEREADYQADIAVRMRLCLAGPEERKREISKRKNADETPLGGLFAGGEA
ncbi:DNA methyltransferase [uncultured Martelella sp.]|uniref:DNA methyltransferase n=1 Tax=uncultured Martelella sp. TaxID=392331 RepID=UPI0029C73D5C|nr:DNA methyltransferase [uncultured Martelella sp.]